MENSKQLSFKKKLKIIVVNLLLFLFLFHVADFWATQHEKWYNWIYADTTNSQIFTYLKHYSEMHNYSFKYDKKETLKQLLSDNYNSTVSDNKFRPIENINADKSILVFGCSFAYGDGLENDETFSYNLGKELPEYRIYNRARGGWTTSQMLYQLENKDFSDIPNVKDVIYIFIPEHILRNIRNPWCPSCYSPVYELNQDNFPNFKSFSLKYIDIPLKKIISKQYIMYFYETVYVKGIQYKYKKYDMNLAKSLLIKTNNLIKSKMGKDVNFIILRYDRGKNEPYNWMFEELKNEGIIVVSLKKLSDTDYNTREYQLSDYDKHPNARAWKEITPLFVKYLQDRGYLKD